MSWQLRTRKGPKSKVVSEVVSTSDKEEPKKQGHVRSHGNFGQRRAQKAKLC
ncbi:hypothetical protein [Neobacillus drentensis]|uniref:hypothetical protein n=1 Tax=Neobacillus drentensis TaxID=220684 RepID=UPI0030007491